MSAGADCGSGKGGGTGGGAAAAAVLLVLPKPVLVGFGSLGSLAMLPFLPPTIPG